MIIINFNEINQSYLETRLKFIKKILMLFCLSLILKWVFFKTSNLTILFGHRLNILTKNILKILYIYRLFMFNLFSGRSSEKNDII